MHVAAFSEESPWLRYDYLQQDPRTFTARGVVPYMPPPECLVPYIRDAGFGGPLQMGPFDYDMPLVSDLLRGRDRRRTVFICRGGSARSRRGIPSRSPHGWRPDQLVCAGLSNVVRNKDLGHGPGISGQSFLGRRGKELRRGEAEMAEASSLDDFGGRRPAGGAAVVCTLVHHDDDRSRLSWGSAVLCWTYHHLCIASRRDNLEMSGCLPLVISWIYQRFPRFCPPDRDLMVFPLVSRLSGLGQISRDTHTRRMLDFRNELDRVGVDDFVWTPYMAPHWRAIEPGWVNEVGEVETWLAVRQFGSEQAVPLDLVNLDGFLRVSARGDDKWWPTELAYWYGFWHNRRRPEHHIQIVAPHYPGWPTQEYAACWAAREPIVLPHDAPFHGRRARMQRPDIRRKGEGTSTSGRSDAQPGGDDGDEEAEYHRQEDIPQGGSGGTETRHASPTSTSSPGEGSGTGTAPHASGAGTSFNQFGPPNEMYDVFSCGDQTMDPIAHEYRASCAAEDTVCRPGPPLQPHHDPDEQLVLPAVPAAVLSVTFPASVAVPAHVQLSHPVAAATVLCERVTVLTPPAAR
ncbi:hypothetical protein PIB30_075505 [Stylosanthes scabra]|uniref:Aminotransferase-like plant mobile domain-containing protein n=1 Tax=Stylosanthes scabra TaxID=79078 RepID=A0ABU6TQN2_9FABA|nr:hypothetical protein [Stylosanthes scabra]